MIDKNLIENAIKTNNYEEIKGLLADEIRVFVKAYSFMFTPDSISAFIDDEIKATTHSYIEIVATKSFEDFFAHHVVYKLDQMIIDEIKEDKYELFDKYLNEKLSRVEKINILSLASTIVERYGENDIVGLMNHVTTNEYVKKELARHVADKKFILDNIKDEYQTDTFMLMVDLYCANNGVILSEPEIVKEDVLRGHISSSLQEIINQTYQIHAATKEENIEWSYQYKNGDLKARDKLVNHNARLVLSIAKRYQKKGLSLEDLYQEGVMGLIRAIDTFDPSKGYMFSTYATWWIRQAVQRGLYDKGKNIRIPVHLQEKFKEYFKVKNMLATELGREPYEDELAAELNISLEEVRNIRMNIPETISLEQPVNSNPDEDGSELINFISDKDTDVEKLVVDNEYKQYILSVFDTLLTEKEKDIVVKRLGLDGNPPMTLESVGRIYHITRERVRQIEQKALLKVERSKKLETENKLDLNIDKAKLIEFLFESNLNKYDVSRLLPKFADGSKMGEWFIKNYNAIYHSNNVLCLDIIKEYKEYKEGTITEGIANDLSKYLSNTFKTIDESKELITFCYRSLSANDKANLLNNYDYYEIKEYETLTKQHKNYIMSYELLKRRISYVKDYVQNKCIDIINDLSKEEFSMFIKDFDPKVIDELKKLYGKNLNKRKNIKSILSNEKLLNLVTNYYEFLRDKYVNESFYSHFKGVDKQVVDDVLSMQPTEYVMAVQKAHNNDLSSNYNINALDSLNDIKYFNCVSEMKKDLSIIAKSKKYYKEAIRIYYSVKGKCLYDNYGISKTKINGALAKLSKKQKDFITKAHNKDFATPVDIEKIGIDNIGEYNLIVSEIKMISLKRMTIYEKLVYYKKSYYELFDYKKEDIDRYFSKLSEMDQEIVLKLHKNDLSNPLRTENILQDEELTLYYKTVKRINKMIAKDELSKYEYTSKIDEFISIDDLGKFKMRGSIRFTDGSNVNDWFLKHKKRIFSTTGKKETLIQAQFEEFKSMPKKSEKRLIDKERKFNERLAEFLQENDLDKFNSSNKKLKFSDGVLKSAWFRTNRDLLLSKGDEYPTLIKQYDEYRQIIEAKRQIQRSTLPFDQKLKEFIECEDMNKFETNKKDHTRPLFSDGTIMDVWFAGNRRKLLSSDKYHEVKEQFEKHRSQRAASIAPDVKYPNYYSRFTHTKEEVDEAFEKLPESKRIVVLKAHNNDLNSPRQSLSMKENATYVSSIDTINIIVHNQILINKYIKSFYENVNHAKEEVDYVFNRMFEKDKRFILEIHNGDLNNKANFDDVNIRTAKRYISMVDDVRTSIERSYSLFTCEFYLILKEFVNANNLSIGSISSYVFYLYAKHIGVDITSLNITDEEIRTLNSARLSQLIANYESDVKRYVTFYKDKEGFKDISKKLLKD